MPAATVVRIEFGSACLNHGAPEFAKLSTTLLTLFTEDKIRVCAIQLPDYFNHFRVCVDSHLVFDSYTRYPPTMEVAKCIETVQMKAIPTEIPYSRGIPFSYWRCPSHEAKLMPQQEGGCFYRRISDQQSSILSSNKTPKRKSIASSSSNNSSELLLDVSSV